MSVSEVERLAHRKLIEEDSPRAEMTHYIRDGSTDVWFVFSDDKLKSVQVLWAEKMMRYASYPRRILCE
jgi:hypothetical protein